MQTRNEVAREFLRTVLGPLPQDSVIELRVKKNDEQGTRQSFYTSIDQVNIEQFGFDEHVWFGVALRRRGTTRGDTNALTWAPLVWADFDNVEDKDAVVAKLRKFQVPPTTIVDSGGGIHAYWRLARVLDLSQDTQATYIREVVHGLASSLGADPTVHDPARVLRVPGTFNVGNGKTKTYSPPREVVVLESHTHTVPVEALSKFRKGVVQKVATRVALPTNAPAVVVADLRVAERIKKFILNGWVQGCGYRSRSELDHAVVIALVRAEHTDDEITALFRDTSNKISSKYYDKGSDGDRYLATTIASAREWVKKAGDCDVRERNGKLEVKREKTWAQVFSRPIQVVARLEGEEDGFRIRIPVSGTKVLERTLYSSDMNTNSAFKKRLGLAGAWTGDDRDVQRLIDYFDSQNPPVYRAVRTVGRSGDTIIFPNGQLAADGTLTQGEYLYTGQLVDARLEDNAEWDKLAHAVLTTLPKLNQSSGLIPVIGWFMATFVAPQVRQLSADNAFPLLMLFGSPEGGKTTTFEVLQTLCGRHSALFALREQTVFTAMEIISSSNTLPIVFDEHRRTDKNVYRRNDLYPTFRMAYQAGIGTRGRADLSIVRYHLTAPVAIAGEMPFRDPALVDRTVHVRFERDGKDEAALKHLVAHRLHQFNAGFYRHVATKDLAALMAEAERMLPAELNTATQVRQRHAWSVVALGLLLLEPFWSRQQVEEAIAKLQDFRQDTADDVAPSQKAVVYEAIRIIAELIRARRINDGVDYVIREQNGEHLLWFVPALVLPNVEEYAQRQGTDMPMTRDAIRQRMREESQGVDPVVAVYQGFVKMGNKSTRANALHLENIDRDLGIPVDYWMKGALIGTDTFRQ